MQSIEMATKLAGVKYEIRGHVLAEADRMEASGQKILKLHIGNPAPFGFDAPASLRQRITERLELAQGYSESKGLLAAREAIVENLTAQGIQDLSPADVYIGNGVSELIVMVNQALLNSNDEVLIPAPDYPLWTAAVRLAGGKAVHYLCDESSSWAPALDDIASKITERTRGIVLINPNNPTGAVYSLETLQAIAKIASEKKLIIFADEIYSRIVFGASKFIPMAKVAQEVDPNVVCFTFNGISKNSFAAGFRCGWMVLTGGLDRSCGLITGLNMLASLRLCANVPAMVAVETALKDEDGLSELLRSGGRLNQQKEFAYHMINSISGLSCTRPDGSFYLFPKFDLAKLAVQNDEGFALGLLRRSGVLVVPGSAFNYPTADHFRIVFLPNLDDLGVALGAIDEYANERRIKA